MHRRRPKLDEWLTHLVKLGLIDDRIRIECFLDTAPVVEQPAESAVVHGDLHSGQIIVNEQHELAGVIDWGDVHIGHPAVDFAAVHAMIPRDVHEEFFENYGPIDATVWAAAKARAVFHTIALLVQASDVNDASTIVEARSSLKRLLE